MKGLFPHIPNVPYHQVHSVYRGADIFVYTSLHEGSALAIGEALASGLPVITTANAGSVVRDGEEGYIVPIRNVEALMDRILTLYRATRAIGSLIEKDWKIVEFGSGMSTPWLGRRCGFLLSIESDAYWYRKVNDMLRAQSLDNVRCEMREPARYCDLSGYSDGFFDFALIDSLDRAGCVRAVIPKIRRGGWVYLDNSDKDMTRPGGDLRRAEEGLLREIEDRSGSVRYFVDFSPTNFFVEQGMLAHL